MDVTSLLSVPVWIMEPFTILQKAAEIMEYTELLDSADQCEDPHERCLTAFYTHPRLACKQAQPRLPPNHPLRPRRRFLYAMIGWHFR